MYAENQFGDGRNVASLCEFTGKFIYIIIIMFNKRGLGVLPVP
jgi:hypothetical protein